MPSHAQVPNLFELRKDRTSFFSLLPLDVANLINCNYDHDPKSEISIALQRAAAGEEADIDAVVAMVQTNPQLLLQAGDVVTRGGVLVRHIKLYEFFLGEGDLNSAQQMAGAFANLSDGMGEKERQCNRYREPPWKKLKQIETYKPAFDLRPLIQAIQNSTDDEIKNTLNINDPNRTETRNTYLRQEFAKFRRAVQPTIKTSGQMHYEHYTTLMQAFDLLIRQWKALSNHDSNHAKCLLIWRQVIGYLQRSLPAVDRFVFARFSSDSARTVNYKIGNGAFPNISFSNEDLSGLGFDAAIFDCDMASDLAAIGYRGNAWACWNAHLQKKNQAFKTYAGAAAIPAYARECNAMK